MVAMIPEFPVLQTPRLGLRQIVRADQPQIFLGLSDPQVTQYYGIHYETLESTSAQMDWYELVQRGGTGLWWGLHLAERPDVLIGTCGFYEWEQEHQCAELGFWLLPDFANQGLMRETCDAVLRYGFRHLQLHRVQARAEPANLASCRLLERTGFQLEGILRECERKQDRYVSLHCYSLLRTDAAAAVYLKEEPA